MKKNNALVAAILGIVIVVLMVFYGQPATKEHGYTEPEQVVSYPTESELIVSSSGLAAVPDNLDATATSKPTRQQADATSTDPAKIAYNDDWCISFTDLNPQDFAYYQRERENWNITRGRILPAIYEGRVMGNHASSQYIAPYMEASYDAIRLQIKEDNEFAMLAALYRPDLDLDFDTQRAIAHRLVVKGHTSTALSHLVNIEMVHARTIYRRSNQVNKEAEQHLYKAMAYTIYGIKHFDLDPASAYLSEVSSANFPLELKPRYALGTDNRIQEYLDWLTQWIDEERANENLQLPTADEFPKVARHNFESLLSRLHLDYGNELQDLKAIVPETTSTLLEGSECVQRQVTFFGDLERRARSSIK